MRLSERLLDEAEGYGPGPTTLQADDVRQLATLIREAAALAKRYEDAPVVELTECNQIEGATDFDWGDMQAAIGPMKPGQRVRLVVEGGEW